MIVSAANEETCETMDEAAKVAAKWEIGVAPPELVEWLKRWVLTRMTAYTDGGWSGEQEDMVEWIAIDLALDEKDARKLCDKAGWQRSLGPLRPPGLA